MPIRFGPSPRPQVRQVLQFFVDAPLWVVCGTDKAYDREHLLHWLSAEERTIPCTHEDCPWHHLPTRIQFYVPCLLYGASSRSYREFILPIHWGMREFLNEERQGVIWEFRRRKKKNARVTWTRMERQSYSQPFAGFDIEERLAHMWGMYANAKRTADRPEIDPPRLFDEPPAASEAG